MRDGGLLRIAVYALPTPGRPPRDSGPATQCLDPRPRTPVRCFAQWNVTPPTEPAIGARVKSSGTTGGVRYSTQLSRILIRGEDSRIRLILDSAFPPAHFFCSVLRLGGGGRQVWGVGRGEGRDRQVGKARGRVPSSSTSSSRGSPRPGPPTKGVGNSGFAVFRGSDTFFTHKWQVGRPPAVWRSGIPQGETTFVALGSTCRTEGMGGSCCSRANHDGSLEVVEAPGKPNARRSHGIVTSLGRVSGVVPERSCHPPKLQDLCPADIIRCQARPGC